MEPWRATTSRRSLWQSCWETVTTDPTYHAETLEEAYASRASYGAPEWEVGGWVTSYAAIVAGEMNVVSETVSELTGRAPMTLADFLRRYPESYQHLLSS